MLVTRKVGQLALLAGLASAITVGCNRASTQSLAAEPARPDASIAPEQVRPKGRPQARLPMGKLDIIPADGTPPIQLRVEIATKPDERQQGMMFREHMGEDEGMLFAFP